MIRISNAPVGVLLAVPGRPHGADARQPLKQAILTACSDRVKMALRGLETAKETRVSMAAKVFAMPDIAFKKAQRSPYCREVEK